MACAQSDEPFRVAFEARLGDRLLNCEDATAAIALTDLRFYVSEPVLIRADGIEVPVSLAENGRWQQQGLALIDLESAAGNCTNGTPDSNAVLLATVPSADYEGIRFTVGVPFARNHADPLLARPPLDDSTMHWHWRSGYKFLRAGFASADTSFWMHLGSAGCEGTVQHIRGCRFPNRVDVTLVEFRPGDSIAFDFAELRASVEQGVMSDCSSGPAEDACRASFRTLGIDFDTGEQAGVQRLFRVVPQ